MNISVKNVKISAVVQKPEDLYHIFISETQTLMQVTKLMYI